jgi:uncharacterized protein (DUF3820 family)
VSGGGLRQRGFKPSARLDFLTMPLGKFQGLPIGDVPSLDLDYSTWLIVQPWFRKRYPDESLALARAIEIWADPDECRRLKEKKQRAFEARQAERLAELERRKQDWLDRHVATYQTRGVMPFGKYKGRPLAEVARDKVYCRWFAGSTYAKMNPELAADLAAGVTQITTGKPVLHAVEIREGGCVVYRPAVWCRTSEVT